MIPLPAANAITRPYRGLSVQEVDIPLTQAAILDHLVGRDVYRRTDWLVLRRGPDSALVAVRKASLEPLFSPVVEARVLAGPSELVWVEDPGTDVANATALARAAAAHHRDRALAYAVQGRYQHVNVIWRPQPVSIRVTEVVPPEPAKLYEMAVRAVAFDEDLPPVELVLDAVDLRALAADHPAPSYLLPCRGSGVDLPAPVSFLDTHPPAQPDWLLLGCERSRQFHRHMYGSEPSRVDICPRARADVTDRADGLTLTKCCLRERGVERDGRSVVVPWGSTLDEVRLALRLLTGVEPAQPGAQVEPAGTARVS